MMGEGPLASNEIQEIINAIPGGVAVYKVSDRFETVYFSDGVPELSGYTAQEYRELIRRDAAWLTYEEDRPMAAARLRQALRDHTTADFEFRKMHRDGHIVWVHIQARQIGAEDGCPLLQCVFHNISALKETQLELDHLLNSIPGGIISYRVENGSFLMIFISGGAAALSGYTREEYTELFGRDFFESVCETDRERVKASFQTAFLSGQVLDISYRMRHRDGGLVWIHVNGRRMGPLSEAARFYAVFTGMSEETRLFQSIANETADGIYVIDKANYDLLYANESRRLFTKGKNWQGKKCYTALHGRNSPCEFCTLTRRDSDGLEHEMMVDGTDRYYATRFRETKWNGIPAYVKYVREITEEVHTRREKERLEQYFKNVVENLPGGVCVLRCEADGRLTMEFISDGLCAMLGCTAKEAVSRYENDTYAGVFPEDVDGVRAELTGYLKNGEGHCEFTARLRRGETGYVWVKIMLSILQTADGVRRLYVMFADIGKTMEEKDRLQRQYEELILQHYRTPGPNALIVGHCNITQNRILEIIDHTDSDLLKTFGDVREEFFAGIAGLVTDGKERNDFLNMYLNEPALAAFNRGDTEQILNCFIKLPRENSGRYVQFKVSLVETPDTGDITGILTVTDITEQTISDRILHQLSVTGYDFVVDLNLKKDSYHLLARDRNAGCIPKNHGSHSERVAEMLEVVVPRDRETYRNCLTPDQMVKRLEKEGQYTFSFSIAGEDGDIRTKNMTVSAIDLRLGRICLLRTDITDSVRGQQGLLNMMAYTFELMGFINISQGSFVMYTRETVLNNLSPYCVDNYNDAVQNLAQYYEMEEDREEVQRQFRLENMLMRLAKKPSGYDFVFPYRSAEEVRYKQINVLWGDQNHGTVCLVRADVTDILTAERQAKKSLETALSAAKEANHAKSAFLSAMSHDIRTPMNAIMGMTALAVAHLDDRERVADCLQKITISSRHLLSLINDVLDMSKIESSKITLNRVRLSLPDLTEQLKAMMAPQARASRLELRMQSEGIRHKYFYGDSLRISQILINILSNAVKYTPEGGRVDFLTEEILPDRYPDRIRYRFTVRDTGIGIPEQFLGQLFDPFTRSRNSAGIEGTGLGLSITKGLIELMGGSITVESEEGRGSVFQVELEFEPAPEDGEGKCEAAGAQSAGRDNAGLFAGRLFLVAEDNVLNAEILSELLSMYGAKTVVTANGVQAVRAFQSAAPGTYDAVLMDIQMPEMNGYEATRAIRETKRSDAANIPIIAMTANAFAEDIQESLEAGMTAHVAKPIDIEVLRAALEKVGLAHGINIS